VENSRRLLPRFSGSISWVFITHIRTTLTIGTPYRLIPKSHTFRNPTDIVEPGEQPAQSIIDAYDSNIRATDELVGELLDTVEGANVALTGDHGEEFGLHGDFHEASTYGDILARRKRRASLPQRGTRSSGSVSRLALPASMGRVSTLGRERLVALSRALPSESVSSRSIFNRPLSHLNRSNLAVLCRHGSHLVGQRPSTGLSRAPQTWVECGPHPALVRNGMWRNPIETHVCGRLSGFGGGSGRATGGGCVTERTRFTPAVNGGILSLIKDRKQRSRHIQLCTCNWISGNHLSYELSNTCRTEGYRPRDHSDWRRSVRRLEFGDYAGYANR